MPLVTPGGNPKVVLDSYLDNSEFDKNVAALHSRLDSMSTRLKAQNDLIDSSYKKSTMSITDFRSAYQVALDVARVGQQVWEETGQKFVDNAIKAGDMARAIGTTTEEASRIKEVADDVGISVDKLTASFRIAQKDGFTPTIAGLAKMSDEYLALAPGIERAQYLQDRFGKGGEEMGKLLDKGSKAIRDNAAAIDENMVVTEEAYKQAREFQVAQDSLKDSWDALTYQAAPPLVKALTGVINHYRDITTSLKENGYWYTLTHQLALDDIADKREQSDASIVLAESSIETAGAFETEAEAAKRVADEAKAAEQAIRDMTKANQEHLDMIGDMTGDFDSHVEKLHEIRDANAELQDEKKLLISQGYTEESEVIQDINGKIDENVKKYQEATDEFELNGRRRILSMLEQQLAIDGLDARETDYLLSKGLEWGVYSETAVLEAQRAMDEVALLSAEISRVPTAIPVVFTITTVGAPPNLSESSYSAPVGTHRRSNAEGGSYMIPQSYGNEGFMMSGGDTASGGEQLKIIPKGQSGGGIVVNIMLDSATPDPERVAYNLGPAVKRVLRAEGIL